MKKLLALTLALVMVLGLAACGAQAPAEAPATEAPAAEAPAAEAPAEPAEPAITTAVAGKLTVVTSPDFAPYEFYAIDADGNPQLAGFDMAFAQYLADYMGLELEVVPVDFDGILAEMKSGNADIALAGLSPKPERLEAMDFSEIYYFGGQSFICSKSTQDKFTDLASANNKDYSIGAQTGSIQFDLATENTPDADVIALTKVTDIVAEIVSGKLDGAFMETVVAETYAKNYPELVVLCDVPYEEKGSCVGVSKGNEALLAAVNEAVAAALADGSMEGFIVAATEASGGDTYLGLLDNYGK